MKRRITRLQVAIVWGTTFLAISVRGDQPLVGVRPIGGDSSVYRLSDTSSQDAAPTDAPNPTSLPVGPAAIRRQLNDSYYDGAAAHGQQFNSAIPRLGDRYDTKCDGACDAKCDGACDAKCDGACDANCDGARHRRIRLPVQRSIRCDVSACDGKCGNTSCDGGCCYNRKRCALYDIGGWFSGGMTYNSLKPVNPRAGLGNLPVGFNTRSNNAQLQQAYLYIERATDSSGCGWDIGGRVDALFGEDYFFTQAVGLEMHQSREFKWNGDQTGNGFPASALPGSGSNRNGLALPQAYLEFALGYLTVKAGHFYTTVGHESVMAVDNFFYSRSYTMQFGEAKTHTGALGILNVTNQLTAFGGIHNGWDVWWQEGATRNSYGLLAGLNWVGCDGNVSLTGMVTSGDDADFQTVAGAMPLSFSNRTMYSVVGKFRLTDRLESIIQHDLGIQTNGGAANGQNASWYGVNSYLMYTINDCWRAGVRYEWFNDQNGFAILRNTFGPGIGSHFHAVSFGLNYKPRPFVLLRPEVRWDWQDYHTGAAALGALPIYNLGNPAAPSSSSQFTVAMDIVIKF